MGAAEIIADDFDTQPYRLKYQDGSLSSHYYRVEHVSLVKTTASPVPAISGSPAPPARVHEDTQGVTQVDRIGAASGDAPISKASEVDAQSKIEVFSFTP